jgi:hypothetical protein
MQKKKLVREMEGYKFYTIMHETKEAAEAACLTPLGFKTVYDSDEKCFLNQHQDGYYQDDIRESP